MNKTITELKTTLENAEREHRHAILRQQWLERRLLETPTESEFHSLLAELIAQEENTSRLGQAVALARYEWGNASINGHRASEAVQG